MERLGLPRKAEATHSVRARIHKSRSRIMSHFSVSKGQNANFLALLDQDLKIKSRKGGKRPAWMNKELLAELR